MAPWWVGIDPPQNGNQLSRWRFQTDRLCVRLRRQHGDYPMSTRCYRPTTSAAPRVSRIPSHSAKAIVQTGSYLAMMRYFERHCGDIKIFKFCTQIRSKPVLESPSERRTNLTI